MRWRGKAPSHFFFIGLELVRGLGRYIDSQEGGEVRRRAEFFSGWKAFAKFCRLGPPFILHFQLKRQTGVLYVKVFDGSLCLKEWEESDDDMTPPPA